MCSGTARRPPDGLHRHVCSGCLSDFRDTIPFLEDVEEAPYSLDRMLTQLKLAGIPGRRCPGKPAGPAVRVEAEAAAQPEST